MTKIYSYQGLVDLIRPMKNIRDFFVYNVGGFRQDCERETRETGIYYWRGDSSELRQHEEGDTPRDDLFEYLLNQYIWISTSDLTMCLEGRS
jgi:hypothetical protein